MLPAIIAALESEGAAGAAAAAGSAAKDSALGSMTGQLTDTLNKLKNPIKAVNDGFKDMLSALTFVPRLITDFKDSIVSTAGALTEALSAPLDLLKGFAASISQFTSLSNPGGMKMLEFHMRNSQATIGNILQPILDAVTRSVEKVGDAFAKLKPAFEPMMRAAEILIDIFGDRFIETSRALAPVLHTISDLFLLIAQATKELEPYMLSMIRRFGDMMNAFRAMLGLPAGRSFDENAKSDLAVREPQFRSAEAIFNEQARNAVMASMGGDKQKDVPNLLDGILKKLQELPKAIADELAKILGNATRSVETKIEQVEDSGRSAASGAASAMIPVPRW